jgi:hypothetical protein
MAATLSALLYWLCGQLRRTQALATARAQA